MYNRQQRAPKLGLRVQVEERMGPAIESLQALLGEGKEDSFDFAFIGVISPSSVRVSVTDE